MFGFSATNISLTVCEGTLIVLRIGSTFVSGICYVPFKFRLLEDTNNSFKAFAFSVFVLVSFPLIISGGFKGTL